jgi:hypothetical protein
MAVDEGEEEATSADLDGAMDDQRRRRRLTLAPTPSAMDEVTVEEIFDDDSDSDCAPNQGESSAMVSLSHSALLLGHDVDPIREGTNGNSVDDLLTVTANQMSESELKEQLWSSVGFPKGSRWWEEDTSNTISNRQMIAASPLVTNPGSAKIVVRPPSNTACSTKTQTAPSATKNKMLSNLGDTRRGVRVRPWRGLLP